MMKQFNKWTTVCVLVVCVLLCGCGETKGQEVIAIGQCVGGSYGESLETDVPENSAAAGDAAVGAGAGSVAAFGRDAASAETEAPRILVHVCGAVRNPGVVSLPEGSRAEDALLAAGGFAENASQDYVNLAGYVNDGEKLYFPTREEAVEGVKDPSETGDGRVNINTADVAALCTLPGIGESRARDIIAYREAQGVFESCEDIMKVSGIKASVYSKISDRIKVR